MGEDRRSERTDDGAIGVHPVEGPPAWLSAMARRGAASGNGGPGTPAAVLVLVSDHLTPCVLLTTRSASLRAFPNALTLPGGRAEAPDRDPAATAVREAREETGLDPGCLRVLGQLGQRPAAGGYEVTPVLAWTSRPRFDGAPNPAEVAAVRLVPLAEAEALAARARRGTGNTTAALPPMTRSILVELTAAWRSASAERARRERGGRSAR